MRKIVDTYFAAMCKARIAEASHQRTAHRARLQHGETVEHVVRRLCYEQTAPVVIGANIAVQIRRVLSRCVGEGIWISNTFMRFKMGTGMPRAFQPLTKKKMTEPDLFEALAKKYNEYDPDKLAILLGVSGVQLRRYRDNATGAQVKGFQVANLIAKAHDHGVNDFVENLILPIVEFYPLDNDKLVLAAPTMFDHTRNEYCRALHVELKRSQGVYIFYDSRGNAIYVGKTEKLDLWTEANNALARDRKELQRVRLVDHPRTNVAFKPAYLKERPVTLRTVLLSEIAHYVSVYRVDPLFIGSIEALLVRAFANDLLNKRMESFPHLK